MTAPTSVVELRQYTLHPGGRDVLIDLFEREFVETQEAVGIRVIGQFRDEADPNRFVWLRGFPDMDTRKAALTAFYLESEAWKKHGTGAAATMIDSDDVLLLRPATPGSGFAQTGERPPIGAPPPASRVMATILHRDAPVDDKLIKFFDDEIAPFMTDLGAAPIANFQTEPAENTFPRLPVRTARTSSSGSHSSPTPPSNTLTSIAWRTPTGGRPTCSPPSTRAPRHPCNG